MTHTRWRCVVCGGRWEMFSRVAHTPKCPACDSSDAGAVRAVEEDEHDKPGPTGRSELNVKLSRVRDVIELDMGVAVTNLIFSPDQARAVSRALEAKAAECEAWREGELDGGRKR